MWFIVIQCILICELASIQFDLLISENNDLRLRLTWLTWQHVIDLVPQLYGYFSKNSSSGIYNFVIATSMNISGFHWMDLRDDAFLNKVTFYHFCLIFDGNFEKIPVQWTITIHYLQQCMQVFLLLLD